MLADSERSKGRAILRPAYVLLLSGSPRKLVDSAWFQHLFCSEYYAKVGAKRKIDPSDETCDLDRFQLETDKACDFVETLLCGLSSTNQYPQGLFD